MKQINLRAKVLKIPKSKCVFTRFGNYAAVTNALIADETGNTKLCLWNEQISSISEGDIIQIENARTSMFKGEQQLRITKNGKLSVIGSTDPIIVTKVMLIHMKLTFWITHARDELSNASAFKLITR